MESAQRNPLIFIFVTRLIDSMGFGIVMPVLPQLLLHMGSPSIAAAARVAGILLVVYSVLQFLCGPIIGNLSDRFGRRPVILFSLLAFGLDYLFMGFAPTIAWLFVGRAIAGVAGAVYAPANAFIADVTPPEKRAQAFGMVSAAFGLGFILGPAIGGLLGEMGPRAPFFAAAALAGLNLLFGIFVLPESLPKERRRAFSWARANPLGAAIALYRYPAVLGFAFVTLLVLIGNNVYPSVWSFFTAVRFDWSPGMIGLSLATTGLGMSIVQGMMTGKFVRAFGERGTAVLGMSVAIAAYCLYAFMPYGWMVFPVALLGALQALAFPALNALMSQRVRADQQGELQGAVASLMSLSSIIGPFMMTQALALFTAPDTPLYFPGAPFIVAAFLSVLALTLLLKATPRSRPDPQ
jgi:DHA1 family tetracycline resistance protein-like MFS transporter